MQVWGGTKFWPLEPKPEDITIAAIARSLSNECRFGGHVREFYSVAQHSVRASYMVPPDLALCGLLHDASEAYLRDVPTPLKMEMPRYLAAEDRVMRMIAERFRFPWPLPPAVKHADYQLLCDEAADLVDGSIDDWNLKPDGSPVCRDLAGPMEPKAAEYYFLKRFFEILKDEGRADVLS
jgi:hypothetical protein